MKSSCYLSRTAQLPLSWDTDYEHNEGDIEGETFIHFIANSKKRRMKHLASLFSNNAATTSDKLA